MTEKKAAQPRKEEVPVQSEETLTVDGPVQTSTLKAPEPAAPSVARLVHYQEGKNDPLAAVVTAVHGKKVSLAVYREHLVMFRQDVPFSETPKPGHWNWPPRV